MEYLLRTSGQGVSSQDHRQRLPRCILSDISQSAKPFSSLVPQSYPTNQRSLRESRYITKIVGDLHFSKEVVQDRGLACLPYREWNAKGLYYASDIAPSESVRRTLKIHPPRHKLCHLRKASVAKRNGAKISAEFGKSIWKTSEDGQKTMNHQETFLTEAPGISGSLNTTTDNNRTPKTEPGLSYWDDEVLKMLTKTTARWIAGHQTEDKEVKNRLNQRYGIMGGAELISEQQMTEADFWTFKEQEDYKESARQPQEKAPQTEILLPVYYKLPRYLPLAKEESEMAATNKTAESLSVKHYELEPALRLQDLLNPRMGKHVHATENAFEGELYSGRSKIIYQNNTNKIIHMENHNKYEKQLQEILPKSYCEWSLEDGDAGLPARPDRGRIRWTALPTDAVSENDRRPGSPDVDTSPKGDKKARKVDSTPMDGQQALRNIVTHWRGAWILSASWRDATLEQLKRDLTSLHNVQKISALVTISSAAAERPLCKDDTQDTGTVSDVPQEMLPLISSALEDEDKLVRMAAALCQYIIHESSEKARSILFTALENGSDADSWVSAQCLALEGNHSSLVVKRILAQLFEGGNGQTEKQACYLLSELSRSTIVIHGMVGAELSSCNWRDRIVACQTIAQLHGPVSRDLMNKLIHLMWNDWNVAVRGAAARALGQMGQGKLIHDQLRKHLESGSWKHKVNSLSLIGWMNLMTAQLLPGFIQCFTNDYMAVRRAACLAAGRLQIKDEMVLDCLYELVEKDPVWIIQASAIRALARIGHVTPTVKELLLGAVCNQVPGVRVQACRGIAALRLHGPEVQRVLQDRLILESQQLVKREASRTLTALNMEHDGNQEMTSLLQKQISRLCQKEVLIPKVVKLSEALEIGHQKMEMLVEKPPGYSRRLQESRRIANKAFSGE
ncbi:HEAT repeat-containing protein 4 [Pelodytes ibericus]